jgi:small subunit ribosomal protein S1
LEVGQIREGVVRGLRDFGAFVDLGGVEGLVHISQLSWDRVSHPKDVLEEGQRIKVKIEKIDRASGKIGLSYRDLLHQPWEGIESRYPVGTVVAGTVSKIMEFGAFVRLEPGVEGLVHISELSHKRVHKVQHVVREGEPVQVKVLSVDPAAQRISLSLKAAAMPVPAEPEVEEEESDSQHLASGPSSKSPSRPLRGGLGNQSGGEHFGLNW